MILVRGTPPNAPPHSTLSDIYSWRVVFARIQWKFWALTHTHTHTQNVSYIINVALNSMQIVFISLWLQIMWLTERFLSYSVNRVNCNILSVHIYLAQYYNGSQYLAIFVHYSITHIVPVFLYGAVSSFSQNCGETTVSVDMSIRLVCLSVPLRGATGLPLEVFSWTVIQWYLG